MTCPVCKGEKQVFIRAHNESGFVQCPHCRDWGALKRLWERIKGVLVKP